MKTAIQRLPDAEERALVDVACANGLKREELRCHMTRQQGSGRGRHPEKGGFSILSGREFDISYNLMLCEFCGNLEPFEVCPAKVLKIKQKLLNYETPSRADVLAKRIVTCWICGGDGPATCQCHNAAKGKKPYPCNMVCNA